MRVLHLSLTSLAGVPEKYASFFRKHSDIKTRSATCFLGNIKFPKDIQVPFRPSPKTPNDKMRGIPLECDELINAIEEADIIHMHNLPPIASNSPTWEIVEKKPIVLQLHRPPGCSVSEHAALRDKITIGKLLVIAQYQAVVLKKTFPDIIPVRNIVDINDELLLPLIQENHIPIITYTPSNRKPKKRAGWAYKSFNEVEPVLNNLRDKKIIEFIQARGMPWVKILALRKKANIHVDEVSSGSYHLGSLEALSQGTIAVAHIATWMEELLKEVTGCEWLPWVDATETSFKKVITDLLKDKDALLERQKKSRQWMEKYWSSRIILEDYRRIYEEALS